MTSPLHESSLVIAILSAELTCLQNPNLVIISVQAIFLDTQRVDSTGITEITLAHSSVSVANEINQIAARKCRLVLC